MRSGKPNALARPFARTPILSPARAPATAIHLSASSGPSSFGRSPTSLRRPTGTATGKEGPPSRATAPGPVRRPPPHPPRRARVRRPTTGRTYHPELTSMSNQRTNHAASATTGRNNGELRRGVTSVTTSLPFRLSLPTISTPPTFALRTAEDPTPIPTPPWIPSATGSPWPAPGRPYERPGDDGRRPAASLTGLPSDDSSPEPRLFPRVPWGGGPTASRGEVSSLYLGT